MQFLCQIGYWTWFCPWGFSFKKTFVFWFISLPFFFNNSKVIINIIRHFAAYYNKINMQFYWYCNLKKNMKLKNFWKCTYMRQSSKNLISLHQKTWTVICKRPSVLTAGRKYVARCPAARMTEDEYRIRDVKTCHSLSAPVKPGWSNNSIQTSHGWSGFWLEQSPVFESLNSGYFSVASFVNNASIGLIFKKNKYIGKIPFI